MLPGIGAAYWILALCTSERLNTRMDEEVQWQAAGGLESGLRVRIAKTED